MSHEINDTATSNLHEINSHVSFSANALMT